MNNTVILVVGLVVVVLLLSKPKTVPQMGNVNPDGKQVEAPGSDFADVTTAIANAFGKIADTVKAGVQRN